ncbi:MAG: methylated-DNA--[protein]-cysteine S-methyltransferase [Vicinamibacterales bacterium]|nr:methylated-DNA--[protein]-cysteine S-methyltransferase [Vicinamibacterales bacterium]MDP6608957.1 methylated-DNA--[protein]-cysteine S-methyltransferase [Vicinamibacterales bacterium]|tara:strand:- start:814 stop:1587 length:774 start_codon:yes stop_codon:yes gene_type:complete
MTMRMTQAMTCATFATAVDTALVGDADRRTLGLAARHARSCGRCAGIWPEVERAIETLDAVGARTEVLVIEADLTAARQRLRVGFEQIGQPPVRFSSWRSPVGEIFFGMSDRGLCDVTFGVRRDSDYRRRLAQRAPEVWRDDTALNEIRSEFAAYFAGRTRTFSVPTDLRGVTPFAGRVLRLAHAVPFGQAISYGSLARRLGQPRAGRAVGNALGRNPVPIVIPCHRVVRAGGQLGGYVGGAAVKRALLDLEGYRAS